MQILKADTQKIVRIGPAVDISDGYTCLATLDISTADYAYMMHGDSVEVDISSNTWAAVTSVTGWYDLTLTAAQLTTEGPMTIAIYDVSLCLPVYAHFMVVSANVYDSLYAPATTDYLQVDTIQVSGTTEDLPTATALATAQTDLDTITGSDGVTLATAQANYAPSTATALATAQTDLDTLTGSDGATLATSQPNYAPATPAQVNTEVVDALATDTYAELSGVPAATATLSDMIRWLFVLKRNKITQTGTTTTLRNDADSGSIATSATSDDGTTTTVAEWT
jgi:hypothetical protein